MRSLASLPPPLPRQRPRERRPGVRLLAIDECPAHLDPVLGEIFRDMRLLRGISVPILAKALGTTPDVIACLEAGRVRALPPWAEVERLVSGYERHLGFGMGPALRRLRAQIIAGDPTAEVNDLPRPSEARPPLTGRGQVLASPPALPTPVRRRAEVSRSGPMDRKSTGVGQNYAAGHTHQITTSRPRRSRRLIRVLLVPIVLTAGMLGYMRLPDSTGVLDTLSVHVVETIRLVASRIAEAEPMSVPGAERED